MHQRHPKRFRREFSLSSKTRFLTKKNGFNRTKPVFNLYKTPVLQICFEEPGSFKNYVFFHWVYFFAVPEALGRNIFIMIFHSQAQAKVDSF